MNTTRFLKDSVCFLLATVGIALTAFSKPTSASVIDYGPPSPDNDIPQDYVFPEELPDAFRSIYPPDHQYVGGSISLDDWYGLAGIWGTNSCTRNIHLFTHDSLAILSSLQDSSPFAEYYDVDDGTIQLRPNLNSSYRDWKNINYLGLNTLILDGQTFERCSMEEEVAALPVISGLYGANISSWAATANNASRIVWLLYTVLNELEDKNNEETAPQASPEALERFRDDVIAADSTRYTQNDTRVDAAALSQRNQYQAHHIVPISDANAAAARQQLANLGIYINDPRNGVMLPTTAATNVAPVLANAHRHTSGHPTYSTWINERFINESPATPEEAWAIIEEARSLLIRGTVPFQDGPTTRLKETQK